ncbi:UNVERIFIED_CONTAM: hypothetical protein Sradi_4000600 [Sesamum radiatum]|uniref:Uncharacterized protein n=1 Tax=Sesamum radiatum TaxID=300843 RepID=A0AAW2PI11_SESRA
MSPSGWTTSPLMPSSLPLKKDNFEILALPALGVGVGCLYPTLDGSGLPHACAPSLALPLAPPISSEPTLLAPTS